ncbi:MAG TPA: glycosyltransferase family 4 protein [Anaeromyxobacteraceae bacterium]|nr:glycosyltransferase family 4 protein [Anaeromyxobacteraceae bacterium]
MTEPAGPPAPITVVHVITVAGSLDFFVGQSAFMRERGFTLHAIASPEKYLDDFGQREQVEVHAIRMSRRITPGDDLRALWQLWRTLRSIRPDVVHSHTPKAGLLGTIAATLAGTPARLYTVRGVPHFTATGLRRRLLLAAEWTSCALAHRVLAVSHSVRDIIVEEGLCRPDKVKVLASGSGQGVDATRRFKPLGAATRSEVRARCGIPQDALVVGFVGRLVNEKGMRELAQAWSSLRASHPTLHLLLMGSLEGEDDAIPAEMIAALRADERVHFAESDVTDMPPFYSAMDVVALPTYREGFSNVALETAAMALPIVAARVPGCVDAVEDGRTGTLVEPRDHAALAWALRRYLDDPDLRARHGEAARRRVLAEFRPELIWGAIAAEYRALLARVERRPSSASSGR